MNLDEINAAIRELKAEDRRKVALFIVNLEKQHLQETIGPQIVADLEGVSKVVQDALEKIKKHVRENF